jgi:GH24 family phage-related lysozyme (muramidase)
MTIDEQINQLQRKVNRSAENYRREYYPNIPPSVFTALMDFLFFIGS